MEWQRGFGGKRWGNARQQAGVEEIEVCSRLNVGCDPHAERTLPLLHHGKDGEKAWSSVFAKFERSRQELGR